MNFRKIGRRLIASRNFMFFYNNWNALIFIGMSFFTGLRIFHDPALFSIFTNTGFGECLMNFFTTNYGFMGLFLMVPSMVKLYGIIKNKVSYRKISNIALFVIWTVAFFSFLFSAPPNLLSVLSGVGSLTAFGLLLKESAHDE